MLYTRSRFAALAGITPAMVTKYAKDQFIIFADRRHIDVPATLAALEGRLDEDKRRAALQAFADEAGEKRPAAKPETITPLRLVAETIAPVGVSDGNNGNAGTAERSAKAQLDDIRRDTAAIELAVKAGALVPVAEVEARAYAAVAAMRAAYDQERQATAEQLARDLSLPPERVAAMKRTLQRLQAHALTAFATTMGASAALQAEPASAA